jgi:segregation and condensation protein B
LENSNPAANPNPNPHTEQPAAAKPEQPVQSTGESTQTEADSRFHVQQSQPQLTQQTQPQAGTQSQSLPQEPQPEAQDAEAEAKRQHNLVMIEAALYVAGRPLDVNELCSVLSTRSKKKAQQLCRDLSAEYKARSSAIEILELKDERFVMQVKAEFTPLVKRLVNRPLLSSGPLRTLSYIAYRQPITSKRVIEVRGQHAYGHIKMLKDMGLVAPERQGRAIVLKTTDYFADYFGLLQDTSGMKRDLKRIFGDALEAFKDEPQP